VKMRFRPSFFPFTEPSMEVDIGCKRQGNEIRFGARASLRAPDGQTHHVQIVGVDEADPAAGSIAFVAPLARALLGRRVGDLATVRTPGGEEELEVLTVEYADA